MVLAWFSRDGQADRRHPHSSRNRGDLRQHRSRASLIAIPMERQGQVFGRSFLLPWAPASISSSSFPVSIMVYPSNRLFAKPGGAKIFAWRRLSRIVPLYWCAMALLLVKMPVLHKPMPTLRVSSPRFLHSLGHAGHRRAAPDLRSRLDAELRGVLLYRF